MLPPHDYYDHMYDIENLTNLNISKSYPKSSIIKKAEELIRAQQCDGALNLLCKNIKSIENKKEAQMLISALWVKEHLFEGIVEDVGQKSPKYCALQELSEFFNISKDKIEQKMLVEIPVKEDWNRMNIDPANHEDLTKFYRETNSYIYELMAANNIIQTLFTYSVLIERIKKLGIKTILDYGGGAGTLSVLLSQLGYDVVYADLPGKTFQFAKWRFKKRGLKIPIIALFGNEETDLSTNKLKKYKFDCILSTEVIEHVLYPLKLIKSFADKLSPGGVAVISESCGYTEQFASHLESNKKYAGINFINEMNKVGFVQYPVEFFIPQQIFIKS